MGCGGGARGRAVAFCQSRPGSIPGTDLLGFFRFRIAANLFLLGAGLFLKNEECSILLPLLSYFLSPLSIFVNCNINNEPRKKNINLIKVNSLMNLKSDF